MIKVFDAFDLDIKSVQSETLRRLVPTKNFSVDFKTYEIDHIKKYHSLGQYGKEAVDSILDVEHRRYLETPARTAADGRSQMETATEFIYLVPKYLHPMSAGFGEPLSGDEEANLSRRRSSFVLLLSVHRSRSSQSRSASFSWTASNGSKNWGTASCSPTIRSMSCAL